MSSILQSKKNENGISDFAVKFIKEFRIGKLLFQCNAGKVTLCTTSIDILRNVGYDIVILKKC